MLNKFPYVISRVRRGFVGFLYIYVWHKVMIQFILLHVNAQLSQHYLLKKIVSSPWSSWNPAWKSIDQVSDHIFLEPLLYSISLYVCPSVPRYIFMPVLYCFDYYGFVVSFKVRDRESSNFILPFQNCFATQTPGDHLKRFLEFCCIYI